jgi:hypothetical protein
MFGGEYLRPTRTDELEKILQQNESRGFLGMIRRIAQKVGQACLLVEI